MNAANKLRPAPDSQLRRLKELAPADREEIALWKDEKPARTNAEIRERIKQRFGIGLKRDGQLSQFWQWQFRQAAWDQLGEMMALSEEQRSEKFPGQSRDELRDQTIKETYGIARLLNDPKLGLKTAAVDLKDREFGLSLDKFQFDAAKACLALLPELKVISQNKGLTEPQKVQQIRLRLFGVLPEEQG